MLKMSLAHKYVHRKEQQQAHKARRPGKDTTVRVDVTDDVLLTARDDAQDESADEAPARPVARGPPRKKKRRN